MKNNILLTLLIVIFFNLNLWCAESSERNVSDLEYIPAFSDPNAYPNMIETIEKDKESSEEETGEKFRLLSEYKILRRDFKNERNAVKRKKIVDEIEDIAYMAKSFGYLRLLKTINGFLTFINR